MLNLAWVQTFVALVQARSFQAAAAELRIAQPTVSQQLQKLEERLGVVLLHRARAGCELTDAGAAFLPYARSLLRLVERAKAEFTRRRVRVGASSNIGIYLLQPHVKSFLLGRDPASFELVIDTNPSIARQLGDGEIDVAVMEWWQPIDGCVAERWRSEPLVLIVAPGHRLASRRSIARAELAQLELLGGEPGTGTGRLLGAYLAAQRGLPRVGMQLGSTEAVKQAVKAGIGISLVLASAVADEVRSGVLHAIPLADAPLVKELFVAWRAGGAPRETRPSFANHLLAPE